MLSMGADVQLAFLVCSFLVESVSHLVLMEGGKYCKRWDCLQSDDMRQTPNIRISTLRRKKTHVGHIVARLRDTSCKLIWL